MNDVASSGASGQLSMLEAVSDALGLAIFVCDRNDELIFASRPILQFYPVADRFIERGTRLRDFLGAVFDLGVRAATATEKSRRRANRDAWISERVSLHWRERYETVERIARQRWISVRKRRLASGLCVVSVTDISEQKKKEDQIQLDMERIEITEGILDAMPNPVCVKDRSLNYIAVNKAFCTLHGMTAEQILGRSVWDLIEPELAEKFEKSDRMVLETGREYSLPEQIVKADGEDCWVVTHKFRVGETNRALLVTCMNDVTDVVVGFDEYTVPGDKAGHFQIRDYGMFEPAQNCHDPFQAIDMHSLMRTSPMAPVEVAEARSGPSVVPPSGAVAVTSATRGIVLVAADERRETRLLPLLRGLGHDACSVRTAAELADVLRQAQAAGLRVDLVLLDMLGEDTPDLEGVAHLVLDPRWTEGELDAAVDAAFETPATATLDDRPVTPAGPDLPSEWDIVVPAAAPPASDIDVLVAEDNEINQIVFSQILEGLGLSYRIAVNGEEAVRLWHQLHPRLVLMDVSMPVMNGFDATRRIREAEEGSAARTPIVAVTTQALDIDLEHARAAGMDDHIVKPISPDMIDRVRNAYLSDRKDSASKA